MARVDEARRYIGDPVGISMRDGTGTSGVLCDVQGNTLYVQTYSYQDVFPLKQYDMATVSAVHPFPPCPRIQPQPPPRPPYPPYPPYPRVYGVGQRIQR